MGVEAGLTTARQRVDAAEADQKAKLEEERREKVRAVALRREQRAEALQTLARQMAEHLAADRADHEALAILHPRLGDSLRSHDRLDIVMALRVYLGTHCGQHWAFSSFVPASERLDLVQSIRNGHDVVLRESAPKR